MTIATALGASGVAYLASSHLTHQNLIDFDARKLELRLHSMQQYYTKPISHLYSLGRNSDSGLDWKSADYHQIGVYLSDLNRISPGVASSFLSRAPSFDTLLSALQAARFPLSGLVIVGGARETQDVARFFAAVNPGNVEALLATEAVLFYITIHAEDFVLSGRIAELERILITVVRSNLERSKPYIFPLVERYFSVLSAESIVPLLVAILDPTNVETVCELVARLLRRKSTRDVLVEWRPLVQAIAERSKNEEASPNRTMLYDLLAEVLSSSPENATLPEDIESELLRAFFKSPDKALARCLSVRPSAGTLLDTVSLLEKHLGVSDFELTERKKNFEKQMSRPIVDTELYAFHEDDGDQVVGTELAPADEQSLFVRIAILTDIVRHKLANDEPPADLKPVAELLLAMTFKQLSGFHRSNPEEDEVVRQNIRAMANISTLGRFVNVKIRDEFLSFAKSVIQIGPQPESVHARAEWDRLSHNVRCLPVRTAPMLIDSFLPLSSWTPADSDVDFVFIHGLRGGLKTWRVLDPSDQNQRAVQLWPSLCLKDQFSGVRFLAFTYEAPLWYATHKQHYSEIDVKKNFDEMALSLRSAMADAGVGQNGKKVVFITFSMGGLVAKRAVVDDAQLRENTLGMVFFATPHLGSPIADYAYYTPGVGGLLVSPFVAHLSRKSKQVLSLHDSYMSTCKHIPSLSICETAQSDIGAGISAMIVPYESCAACRDGGEVVLAGNKVDHESVSKIRADLMCQDPRITALLDFITKITADSKTA